MNRSLLQRSIDETLDQKEFFDVEMNISEKVMVFERSCDYRKKKYFVVKMRKFIESKMWHTL